MYVLLCSSLLYASTANSEQKSNADSDSLKVPRLSDGVQSYGLSACTVCEDVTKQNVEFGNAGTGHGSCMFN